MSWTEAQLKAAGFVQQKLRLRREESEALTKLAEADGLTKSALVSKLIGDEMKRRERRARKK